jgi:thiol-disulfide isomerase/thioredoxin
MRLCISILFVAIAAGSAIAAPTAADVALVNKYKDMVFSIEGLKPERDFGDQKLFRLSGSILIYVFPSGYAVVETPDHVTIDLYGMGEKEYARVFDLPSGHNCRIDDQKSLEWGLSKELAPDFSLSILGSDAAKVRLSDLRGKVVLLDFWASWCQPCIHSLPGTEAIYRKYKKRGLQVLGVNIEGDTAKASAAVKSLGLGFPTLMSEADDQGNYDWKAMQMANFRLHSVPSMLLIDKSGVIRKIGDVTEREIEEILR